MLSNIEVIFKALRYYEHSLDTFKETKTFIPHFNQV